MYKRRYSYWSLSPLAKWIRTKAGLKNPCSLTWEGWAEHRKECKQKAPVVNWITTKGFNIAQDVVYFIPDVYTAIKVADIWKYFRNLYIFHKALRQYRCWDYSGLLLFMEAATKDMSECHKNHGMAMKSEKTAKELLIVSTLLKRIREDNYTNDVQGWKRKEGDFMGGGFYQKPNTLPNINCKNFYKMRESVKQNDLDLVCKIIQRKLFSFWD